MTQCWSTSKGKNSGGDAWKRVIALKGTQSRSASFFLPLDAVPSGCDASSAFCHSGDKPARQRTLRRAKQGGESVRMGTSLSCHASWLGGPPALGLLSIGEKILHHLCLYLGFLLPISKNILVDTEVKSDSKTGNKS